MSGTKWRICLRPHASTRSQCRRARICAQRRVSWPWCWNRAGSAGSATPMQLSGRGPLGGGRRCAELRSSSCWGMRGRSLPFAPAMARHAPPAPLTCSARDLIGEDAVIYPAQPVAAGMGEAGGLSAPAAGFEQAPWARPGAAAGNIGSRRLCRAATGAILNSECTHCRGRLRPASRRRERGGDSGARAGAGREHARSAEPAGPTKSPGQSRTQPGARLRQPSNPTTWSWRPHRRPSRKPVLRHARSI